MAVTYRITDAQSRPQRRAKNFVERMGRIPDRVKKRINAANEKSAEELAAMMVRLVPVDQGDLQTSITYFEVAGPAGGGIAWRVTAGNNKAWSARYVEFGNGIAPAQPYFYPSIRSMRRLIKRRQLAAFRKGLQDAE